MRGAGRSRDMAPWSRARGGAVRPKGFRDANKKARERGPGWDGWGLYRYFMDIVTAPLGSSVTM